MGRRGDWIQTSKGGRFWPLDPRPEEIDIESIAHALSNQCRFGGHCSKFYSVAEHSVRVSSVLPQEDALWGLLHDAAEAYLVDLPRPIKVQPEMSSYRDAEAAIMRAVCERFGLPQEMPYIVKQADEILLATETRDLMKAPIWSSLEGVTPLVDRIVMPWEPDVAELMFLGVFRRLNKEA